MGGVGAYSSNLKGSQLGLGPAGSRGLSCDRHTVASLKQHPEQFTHFLVRSSVFAGEERTTCQIIMCWKKIRPNQMHSCMIFLSLIAASLSPQHVHSYATQDVPLENLLSSDCRRCPQRCRAVSTYGFVEEEDAGDTHETGDLL